MILPSLLLIFLGKLLGVLFAFLGEGGLLLGCVGFGQTHSIVVSVENSVEFSHEDISDEEHLLLDVHLHDGGRANSPGLLGAVLHLGILLCLLALDLDLSEHLRTEGSHLEFKLLLSLGQVHLLWVKHPLIGRQIVVFTVDHEGEVSKIILTIALNS